MIERRPKLFSSRMPEPSGLNRLTLAYQEHRSSGQTLWDLTETNPTRAGLVYDVATIREALARPENLEHAPDPQGLRSARDAVAGYYRAHGREIASDSIFLTSSTSEAYGYLFKLLADPGDQILVPRPSYPLLDHLTALDSVTPVPYRLELGDAGWRIDWNDLEANVDPKTRALVAVSPNNPTGCYLSAQDRERLAVFCGGRGISLIVDEVFLDYPNPAFAECASTAAGTEGALTFVLSGLSKIAALPQLKLGWILVSGPAGVAQEAQERLELIADTYLSVNAPVQHAAPQILAGCAEIQARILERLATNSAALDAALGAAPGFRQLPREGGWYGVVRTPAGRGGEETALRLLERGGVWVHPGYFYDFEDDDALVVSLLTSADLFSLGASQMARILAEET